jgi:tetratricopeptide (TPR) repeat protein
LSDVYINRGVALGRTGNFRQSIASFSDAIRLAPSNPDGYFNRGTAYFQQGGFEQAIDDFSNVIRLSPGDEEAYYWRGMSNEEAGRLREAAIDYRRFLAISQNSEAKDRIEQKLSRWNAGKADDLSSRDAVPPDIQRTNLPPAQETAQHVDLHHLIVALGERALQSTWFGQGLDSYGEKAQELYAFTEHNRALEGHEFLRITSGIQQTIKGDFQAFDPGTDSPWIFIRAWDGAGFYMETNDAEIKERLKTHLQGIEEVEGASPPYEALFIASNRIM